MSLSFHQASVVAFTRALTNLKAVLAKAKAHAHEHKIDEAALITARLYPDMFPLSRQVQIATDTARGVAARLSGVEPPSFEDTEQSFDELTTRINRTLDYLRTLDVKAFDGAETRAITRPVRGNPHTFTGLNYLMQFGVPNVYFHTATAYAILRHNGVPLGKWDYLEAMD
jgi:hypothetical protein